MEHLLLAATYTGKTLEAAMLQEEIEATQREIIFTLAETGEMRSIRNRRSNTFSPSTSPG
jgi:hypothetical protein